MHEDKNQSFHETDTIIFGGHSQACSEYPDQQVCDILAISQEKKREVWSRFLHVHKQIFLQVDTINIGEYGHSYPKYSNYQVCKNFSVFQERSKR